MATQKQLDALKKARAARAKNVKKKTTTRKVAPKKVVKRAPRAKKKVQIKRPCRSFYVIKVVTTSNKVGYFVDVNSYDDSIKNAYIIANECDGHTLVRVLASQNLRGIKSLELIKKASAQRGNNPVPLSKRAKIERAARLYEQFTGHDAKNVIKTDHVFADTFLKVGLCEGLLYSTTRDNVHERYIHKFKKAAQPDFVVSHDGKQLCLIGGNFTFTDAGITDN